MLSQLNIHPLNFAFSGSLQVPGSPILFSPGHRGCARCLFACCGHMARLCSLASSGELMQSARIFASALRELDDAVLPDAMD